MNRILVYGGISVLFAGAFVVSVVARAPGGAILATGLAAGATFGISLRLFLLYRQLRNRESFRTSYGVRVFMATRADADSPEFRARLARTIEAAVQFWLKRHPTKAADILDAVDGGSVTFSNRVLYAAGPGFEVNAHGLTYGDRCVVAWPPDQDLDTVLNLVRHEIGHMCLGVATGNWDTDRSHQVFEAVEYGA